MGRASLIRIRLINSWMDATDLTESVELSKSGADRLFTGETDPLSVEDVSARPVAPTKASF